MRPTRVIRALLAAALAGGLVLLPASAGGASGTTTGAAEAAAGNISQRYVVVLAGSQGQDGFTATGTAGAVDTLVRSAAGTVKTDLSSQIGVLVVESPSPAFAKTLAASALVEEVGADWRWKGLPDASAATLMQAPSGNSAPEPGDDPAESLQWDMQQIRTDQAHDVQGGIPAVDVGILDSGIDGNHPEFKKAGVSNVDCARGRNSLAALPPGVAVGTPDPCIDNQFHGTHVAGTVGMRANGVGLVGVAPNVTLVPVKVCDASGFCYASAVVDGITYSGDQQLDVINMSFFVDDNEFQESTEFKCSSDPVQRAFRHAVERAVQYARNQGVTPVAALGNSDQDLAHPVDDTGQPISNECEVVPAETQGVIGTASVGSQSEKASYSNYGTGATDVTAPGGNGSTGDCTKTVPSTFPGGAYVCIQGTSMASPHAAGVAALIVSQYGLMGSDGDVKLSPQKVEALMQGSAIDIGLSGYDECFGNGRIDALRAVTGVTSNQYDASAPPCPEYAE